MNQLVSQQTPLFQMFPFLPFSTSNFYESYKDGFHILCEYFQVMKERVNQLDNTIGVKISSTMIPWSVFVSVCNQHNIPESQCGMAAYLLRHLNIIYHFRDIIHTEKDEEFGLREYIFLDPLL